MIFEVEGKKYKLTDNFNDCFKKEEFLDKFTEYFKDYDYIVGDIAYGKLRLKGFNEKNNKNFNKINDYSKIKEYIKDNCAYGCKYFIIKKEK